MRRASCRVALLMTILTSSAAWSACKSISATPLTFGNYVGTQLDVTSTITVNCNNNWRYFLCLGPGNSANANARTMAAGGAARLNYQMFKDAARTSNWGNESTNGCIPLQGNGSVQSYTVYGRVPATQNLAVGAYTDHPTAYLYPDTPSRLVNFTVSATLAPVCTISAGVMDFGAYTGVQKDATGTVTVTCSSGTPHYVNLDNGQNNLCCWYGRMAGPGSQLVTYSLWQDSTRTTPWWNTVYSDGKAGTGTGIAQSLTVYGRIAAGQFVTPGTYSDTVIVTLTY